MSDIRRVPHCTHWGAFQLLVQDGRIVGVEPYAEDPAPSDIIRSVPEWVDPAYRVAKPSVREGWLKSRERSDGAGRGVERFVEVDWDTALGLVAGEIDRVRGEHGNAAIFAGSYGWTSSGRVNHAPNLLKRMLNLVGGFTGHTDTYSIAAGAVLVRHVLGDDAAYNGGANTLDSVAEHTELLLVFGALSPRTAQNESGGIARHKLETHLRRLAERKVRVVLVSPFREDLPEWLDAEWWPIRPNTDTALMLALTREIVAAGRHDADFLARCCSGAPQLLDYLAGSADGTVKDAAWAGGITGIEPARIRALALALQARRSMITVSWSLQRADHGEQPFWAALGLAAAAGHLGRPGGGVGYGYASLGGVGTDYALARSPAVPQGRRPITSFIPVARITDLLEKPGQPFTYQGGSYTYPDTRLVYWAGGNPYHHHQDLNRLRRAWQRPETVVVQEPFWTATARRADIVLPASTSLERNDLAGNKRSDRVMAMHQAVAPVGMAKGDYAIFQELSAHLGVEAAFTEGRSEMDWIEYAYAVTRDDAARQGFAMPEFAEFWATGMAEMPCRRHYTYLADFRADPDAHPLQTATGRVILHSPEIEQLGLADSPPHPAWLPPAEWLGSAETARHPFHLISHQPKGRLHSQLDFAQNSMAKKRDGREVALLHPTDAARLEIATGETVRLWNGRGACLAVAEVTDAVRPSVVILPTGAWFAPADAGEDSLDLAGNPNVLTLDKGSSGFGQGCAAHTCLVSVERYRGNAPPPSFAPPELVAA